MGLIRFALHHLRVWSEFACRDGAPGSPWVHLTDGSRKLIERREGIVWHLEGGRTVLSHEIEAVRDRGDWGY